MTETPTPPFKPWLHLTIGVTISALHMLCFMSWVPDITYVTARFADNWVAGLGLVFNPGDPSVEGFMSPLWLLVLAGLRVVFGVDLLVGSAQWLGFLCAVLTGPLLAWTWQRTGHSAKDAAPLWRWFPLYAWALCGPAMIWAVSGTETALAAFLVTAILYSMGEGWYLSPGKFLISVGLFLLLSLVGFHFAVYGLVFHVALLFRGKSQSKLRLMSLVIFFVGLAAIHFIRWRVMGSFLPSWLMALMGGSIAGRLAEGGHHLLRTTLVSGGLPVVAWIGLVAWKRSSAIRVAALFSLLQLIWILIVGCCAQPMAHDLVPAIPCLILLGTAGLRWSWDGLSVVMPKVWVRDLLIVAMLMWLGASLTGERLASRDIMDRVHSGLQGGIQTELIIWLAQNSDSSQTLAGEEPGFLPYITGRRYLDLTGANDLHLAGMPGLPGEKFDLDYIVGQWHPDVVLLNETVDGGFLAGPNSTAAQLASAPEFQSHWNRMTTIPSGEETVIAVYQRGEDHSGEGTESGTSPGMNL